MRFSTEHPGRDLDINVGNLAGGLNFSLPPHEIEPDQLYEALNFHYDKDTGRLTTRPGLVKETSAAVDPGRFQVAAVTVGGTRYIVASRDSSFYKLDGSTLSLIDTLNGTSHAVYASFNDKLYIASGGTLQVWDGGASLSDVSNAKSCTIVVAKDGRLFTNDTTDDDLVWVSGPLLDSEWGFPGGALFQAGFKDGDSIVAMKPIGHDLVIVKGTNNKMVMVLKGIYPNWQMVELARGTGAYSQHAVYPLTREILLLDNDGLNSVSGVIEYGDLKVDPLSSPIAGYLTEDLNSTGFIVHWPTQAMLLIFPNNTSSLAYVLHYSLSQSVPTYRWTRWLFEIGNLTSAVYDNVSDKIYFGCSNGNIYSLSKSMVGTVYQDDGNDYVQKLATKVFDPPGRKVMFKRAQFMYEPISDGDGKFSLIHNDANTQIDLETFTIDALVVDEWEEPVLDEYDFPPIATPAASSIVRTNKRKRIKNMQIGIVVNQGAVSISRLVIHAAAVGRE